MKAFALLNHMIRNSGKNRQEISREINRSDNYLRVVIGKKSIPAVDMFATIARACGYELHLIGHDEDIVIDPKEN